MDLDTKEAARVANFVECAYSMFDAGGLTPPADPRIAAAGYEVEYWINALDFQDKRFYGYVARATASPGDVIVAIRGTRNAAEWLLDFLAVPVPFKPLSAAGFVALGFQSIYETFVLIDKSGASTTLSAAVAAIAAKAPISSITVTGHSLGSALATLTAADIFCPSIHSRHRAWVFWISRRPLTPACGRASASGIRSTSSCRYRLFRTYM